MKEGERQVFASLPDMVTIYRGFCREEDAEGLSYSLNREQADWFAFHGFHRPGPYIEPTVVVARIKKSRLLGYKDAEEEVVLKPFEYVKGRRLRANPACKELTCHEVVRKYPRVIEDGEEGALAGTEGAL